MTQSIQPQTAPAESWPEAGTETGSPPSVSASAPPATLLSVLMPLYNERRTLRAIVRRVLAAPVSVPIELVIVDDGSTDGSDEVLRELAAADPRIKPVFHEKNRGKGAAL